MIKLNCQGNKTIFFHARQFTPILAQINKTALVGNLHFPVVYHTAPYIQLTWSSTHTHTHMYVQHSICASAFHMLMWILLLRLATSLRSHAEQQ